MGEYFGEPTAKISNQFFTLEYLTQAGPRIVRLFLRGGTENLLAEVPGFELKTDYGVYYFRGGHRFMPSPEMVPLSYIPDNSGLSVEMHPDGVDLSGPIEPGSYIQKSMSIRLAAEEPVIKIEHRIKNCGVWPIEFSVWPITMLPIGGTAFFPTQAPEEKHSPNRSFSICSYSKWTDSRLNILDDYIVVEGSAAQPALKWGYFNHQGWMAYLRNGILFVKRFTPQPGLPHPDKNVNTEMYVEGACLELETLSPLYKLQPGETAQHVEEWQLFDEVEPQATLGETVELIEKIINDK